jgi:hypothetical protein
MKVGVIHTQIGITPTFVCIILLFKPKQLLKSLLLGHFSVISTKEKSHNESNYCDFSFVEMTP